LPLGNKIKFHTTHTKDFGEKNAPKLPDFEDFFSLAEIVILKQHVPTCQPNIARL
jgi:hypothetical protein